MSFMGWYTISNASNRIPYSTVPSYDSVREQAEKEWAPIAENLRQRYKIMEEQRHCLQNLPESQRHYIVATDLFVEKAQKHLTERAQILLALGGLCILILVVLSMLVAVIIYQSADSENINNLVSRNDGEIGTSVLIIYLTKSIAAGAFVGAALYFLAQIARACLHESIVLFNRRHALRFGRLYLNISNKTVSLEDLQSAFKWSDEFNSAFKDINAERIGTNPVLQVIQDAVRAMPDIAKNARLPKNP